MFENFDKDIEYLNRLAKCLSDDERAQFKNDFFPNINELNAAIMTLRQAGVRSDEEDVSGNEVWISYKREKTSLKANSLKNY